MDNRGLHEIRTFILMGENRGYREIWLVSPQRS